MIAHVIFDLDGTLSDPSEGIERSLSHAAERMGVAVPDFVEVRRHIGPPTRQVVAELLQTDDPARIEQAVTLYRERYGSEGLWENRVYAGISALLAGLHQRGLQLWICTGKPQIYAQRIAEHFGFTAWLSGVYGCELDGTRADKAELLAYLLGRERIEPVSAVMVGDRMHDVRAASACGLQSIGVLYGFGSEDELRSAGVSLVCADVAELEAALSRLAQ